MQTLVEGPSRRRFVPGAAKRRPAAAGAPGRGQRGQVRPPTAARRRLGAGTTVTCPSSCVLMISGAHHG